MLARLDQETQGGNSLFRETRITRTENEEGVISRSGDECQVVRTEKLDFVLETFGPEFQSVVRIPISGIGPLLVAAWIGLLTH